MFWQALQALSIKQTNWNSVRTCQNLKRPHETETMFQVSARHLLAPSSCRALLTLSRNLKEATDWHQSNILKPHKKNLEVTELEAQG